MIALVVIAFAVVMIAVELVHPARKWPVVAGWWLRAAIFNSCQLGFVYLAGIAWDGWMQRHRPWTTDGLDDSLAAFIGYLVITFIYYWWHRWRHALQFLWRWFHQLHHSAQRIEVITSFYKHPVELLANALLSSAILYLLVGLNVRAATYAIMLTGIAELFYHWNVRTPYWLGFIIQRPESHCIHHQEGVHSFNYSDLPLWDMLFGTFRNPKEWEAMCGFGADGEARLKEMLLGVDINAR
jgi:sterol desaturase/sphingolipid hydroxylase (fatty acid hydroxylase superfamily)